MTRQLKSAVTNMPSRWEAEGAVINKLLGRLTWKLALKPSEERKQKFSYSVKHPSDWTINLE